MAIALAIAARPPLPLRPRHGVRPPHRSVLGQLQLCPRRRQPGAQPAGRLSARPGRGGAGLFARRRSSRLSRRPATWSGCPASPFPGRPEYRLPYALARSRSAATSRPSRPTWSMSPAPTSSPTARLSWARRRGIPVVASVHTRFETYLQYYGLEWARAGGARDAAPLLPPLRRDRRAGRIDRGDPARPAHEPRHRASGARGVDREQFNPGRRSLEWRRALGIADDELAVAFLGRLVMEKGLDVFADAIRAGRGQGRAPARAGDRRRSGASTGSASACPPTPSSPATRRAPTSRARSPAPTCSSIPRSPRRSATSRSRRWRAGLPVIAAAATGTTSLVQDGGTRDAGRSRR